MPKELFFTISTEKREHIIKAATEEFTKKDFKDVSVNTIIKKAGISRGSFYTYFDDLGECFTYIVKDLRDTRFRYAVDLLKKEEGDYFSFVKELFLFDYDAFKESGRYLLFKNYMYYLQSNQTGTIKDDLILDLFQKLSKDGIHFFDLCKLSDLDMSENDFLDLVELVLLIMINTFLKSENEQLSKEKTISLFNKRVDLLEYGAKRKKPNC